MGMYPWQNGTNMIKCESTGIWEEKAKKKEIQQQFKHMYAGYKGYRKREKSQTVSQTNWQFQMEVYV